RHVQLYALFKVATIGPCNTQRPNLLDFSGRAKWSAWNELGAMDPTSAQTEYI
ncbi:acyl-CoA-binding protein, partial [Entophlyctis helioformis]